MADNTAAITTKIWGMCNVLRDDGVTYGDFLEQLTYLIFLKMADEYARPPYSKSMGILPEIWPAERERQHRTVKAEPVAMMEQRYGVTGADRKTLVAVISTITGIDARYLGMPSQGYQIGEYLVDKEGTLTGPENADLIAELTAKGYETK